MYLIYKSGKKRKITKKWKKSGKPESLGMIASRYYIYLFSTFSTFFRKV